MSSLRQVEANRLNALNSTGPSSVEGKAASSMNALKSGIDADSLIIPGECPGVLYPLIAEYIARYRPATPAERVLVNTLIRAEWQLRRLDKVEHHLWSGRFQEIADARKTSVSARDLEEHDTYGRVYAEMDKTLARLQSRINSFQRSYRDALRDLLALQAARLSPPPPQPLAPKSTSPQIGFVPEIPVRSAPPAAPPPSTPAAAARPSESSRFGDPGPSPQARDLGSTL